MTVPQVTPGKPEPPNGRKIYFQDRDGRPCFPDQTYMWTWAGADQWYLVKDFPLPSVSMTVFGKRKPTKGTGEGRSIVAGG
jgi:hypothetical protein